MAESLHGKLENRRTEASSISLQDQKNLEENQLLSWPSSSSPLFCLGLLLVFDSTTVLYRNNSSFFDFLNPDSSKLSSSSFPAFSSVMTSSSIL